MIIFQDDKIIKYENLYFKIDNQEISVRITLKNSKMLDLENINFSNFKESIEDVDILISKDKVENVLKQVFNEFKLELEKEKEFLSFHKTGTIRDDHYSDIEIRDNLDRYPILLKQFEDKSGEIIELRQTGQKNKYVKKDDSDEILRDSNGNCLYLSEDEMNKKGLALFDTTIGAFNSKGQRIGYASDEFGADGVMVNSAYQKRGIGLELLIEFRKQFSDDRKMGQMTSLGVKLAKSYFKKTNQ